MFPKKLQDKIKLRAEDQSLRALGSANSSIDFSSNDYLGYAKSEAIFKNTHNYLVKHNLFFNGATGSRLLTGNHQLYPELEQVIANYHKAETALIFNSGYDANLGFFSSVPQRNDIILFDEFCHASIRDGISMSHAKSFKFRHNDIKDLVQKITRNRANINEHQTATEAPEIYVVTESVFSMNGDSPDLIALSKLCLDHQAKLIIDEAHAIGVFGKMGAGLTCALQLESSVFARIITFGKAMGCHGAAVLGSEALKAYLVNFSRPFIYTTGLPPHALATLKMAYDELALHQVDKVHAIELLKRNIHFFKTEMERLQIPALTMAKVSEEKVGFIISDSAIQSCVISGNSRVKTISEALKHHGFEVKAILSPTVPKGRERLRFCLHSYNSQVDITKVLQLLATFVADESNV